jgi:hypothetical protein
MTGRPEVSKISSLPVYSFAHYEYTSDLLGEAFRTQLMSKLMSFLHMLASSDILLL